MSNLPPYTHEELRAMSFDLLMEIQEKKSPRLYPYCLIGLPLSEAREKMAEWHKGRDVEILIAGKELCFGDMRVSSWFCKIDENNIMTDVWPSYEDLPAYKNL